ncbi:AP-3 complex subunit delta [Tulasnella sp. 419]|nr:AP-3 complex subunit delta [Tulasnella sp. 419]
MYERDLQDLIRGLRSDAAKRNEEKFISSVIDEIRREITSEDMQVKGGAICKLTYLDMLGYDMSWASFHVVEVMASSHVHLKAGGYLAAVQSFTQDTDVLMLTTNLIKKDLSSATPAEIALSLDCLSQIVTPHLARDIAQDLIPMLNHSRPMIRKRAVLTMYRIIQQYPEVLDINLNRLCEKLRDPDIGVISATINLFCELARQDPQRFLPLAPFLFGLLTSASNNWMLIKVVKLFGALAPHEPRLVKKLQPPLMDLISNTPAVSLIYECVHTCIVGHLFQGHHGYTLAKTCVNKLASFLLDPDQNLKYIALLSLAKIVPEYPQLVAEHQQAILQSTGDIDISIRIRALDLISMMVSRDTLQQVVQHLLSGLASQTQLAGAASYSGSHVGNTALETITLNTRSFLSPAYRMDVSKRIIEMCSRDGYANVDSFEWYLSVLVDLSYVALVDVGQEIGDELISVAVRVTSTRPYAVNLMTKLLADSAFYENTPGAYINGCVRALRAAAWICGEFGGMSNPLDIVNLLLQSQCSRLQSDIKAVFLQSAIKLIGHWMSSLIKSWTPDLLQVVRDEITSILTKCEIFIMDIDTEVQERAAALTQLLAFIRIDLTNYRLPGTSEHEISENPDFPKGLCLIQPLFQAYALDGMGPEAQENVHIPPGFDLDLTILPEDVGLSLTGSIENELGRTSKNKPNRHKTKKKLQSMGFLDTVANSLEAEHDREVKRLQRLANIRNDPYYLAEPSNRPAGDDINSIPVVRLEGLLDVPDASTAMSRQVITPNKQVSQATMMSSPVVQPGDAVDQNASPVPQTASRTAETQPLHVLRSKKGSKEKRKRGHAPKLLSAQEGTT